MDTRSFDVLTDDLPSHHMRADDARDTLAIHSIIQGRRAARARQCGKPGAQCRCCLAREDLSHQHIRALRAAAEAALPRQLGVRLRTVPGQLRPKHVEQRGRSVTITALGAATDHDAEAANVPLRVTGVCQPVNCAVTGPAPGSRDSSLSLRSS